MTADPSEIAMSLDPWLSVPPEDLAGLSRVPLTILESAEAVHQHFAEAMFEEMRDARASAQEIAIVVPLGPKAHYSRLADMINQQQLPLDHVSFFGMDEWLDWQGRPLRDDHPCCLSAYFRRHFLDLIEPPLRPHPHDVIFPSPLDLDAPEREIERRGGIATTYAGFGFQGHIAFNEPPSSRWSPVSLEEFRASRTRIVSVAVDTKIVHSVRSFGGNVGKIPPFAVTLGMSDLLSARRIRLYSDGGFWKQTILRILLFAEPTVDYPVTLVSEHADAAVVVDRLTATCPSTAW
jgi:glucosamine-6-phosphate deaminase